MRGQTEEAIRRGAATIREADALLIAAGAGMGVDSGLPDFRGTTGFWRAYPPYARLGLDFVAMANPTWFATDPAFAWGFYGHRLNLYRQSTPHEGFAILKGWADRSPLGAFVVTSNVDGQFQRAAGFDPGRIVEVHGTIHSLQCLRACGLGIYPSEAYRVEVDEATFRASGPLPSCPRCGAMARPNILMFGDLEWDGSHSAAQHRRLDAWLGSLDRARAKLAIVECGAGQAVPTIRRFCEQTARRSGATLLRINPREPDVPAGQIGLPLGALEALRAIDACRRSTVGDPPA